jgi:hypothetical protein
LFEHRGVDQTLAILKMPVQRTFGHPDCFADILDSKRVDAIFCDDAKGYVKQLLTRIRLARTTFRMTWLDVPHVTKLLLSCFTHLGARVTPIQLLAQLLRRRFS